MINGVERVLHRIEEIKRRFGDYSSYTNDPEVRSKDTGFKDVLKEVTKGKTQDGIDSLVDRYSEMYGVDKALINAVIKVESDFSPNARSSKGALGLMQLMPETAKILGVKDPFSPDQNIEAGVRYLRSLLDEFGGDTSLALAAYNAGPGLVKRLGRIPKIPETENYVRRIMEYYRRELGG